MRLLNSLALFALCGFVGVSCVRYKPNWSSLDSRPLPEWYDEAKVGIFLHWGVFSVPSFNSEWFWYQWKTYKYNNCVEFMEANYPPSFTYADFAHQFTAEFYDPVKWAQLFKESGAKYVVLTSKHHEGFTNWPSKYSFNWNSKAVGPNRDLLGEFASAVRNNTDIHFGLYHSLYEWFHPLYMQDAKNHYKTQEFVKTKTMPELYELVNIYKPELIWSDGDWEAPDTYWNSTEFLAWLYNDSPVKDTIVVNDRWGSGDTCHHGGYYTCQDRYNPRKLQNHKWENAMTIDKKSWGYRRNANLDEYLSTDELITTLVETVSCGGNLLINIGPTKEGTITPIFEERLKDLGKWLSVNGEAIYKSTPWKHQNDTLTPNVWYTESNEFVYASVLDWPKNFLLELGSPQVNGDTVINMLGYDQELVWEKASDGIQVYFPPINPESLKWAWVLKMSNVD